MTLGPVFVIHGGTAVERCAKKDDLVEAHQNAYACWTETFDAPNNNLVLVFATNSHDVWTPDPVALSCGQPSENTVVSRIELDTAAGAQAVKEYNAAKRSGGASITFGFTRYP